MSYEGLYIAKGGVALEIPLCDYSSIIMTLHLLYDCYIQLLTLELPLDKTLHTIYTCTHVRRNRLEQGAVTVNIPLMELAVGHGCIILLELTLLNITNPTCFMHMSYCISAILFTLNYICLFTHAYVAIFCICMYESY